MVRDNKVHLIQTAIQTGKKDGMVCLDQELARLVREGVITDMAAREKSLDIAEYERYLKGAGGAPGMTRFS
jgi:twitching motility protein PilT